MAEEDYLIFFTGEGELRVERRLKKSQVTTERLAQMIGVSHNAEALTFGSLSNDDGKTEDKASSLPGQFCPFHPRSTLEMVEKAQGFCYVYCPEKMCFMFAPASEWKEDIERIADHTHSDVKKYAAQLVCDCSTKLALRKSKQPWSQDRMFLTCHKKERDFFMWIDQPISHATKERLSYSSQPRFTRFHPYREIKETFEAHRQEVKQKGLIQRQHHARKYDEGFLMCDNSLGSPKIFHGPRYREWMDEVWESYKFYVQKNERRLSRRPRSHTLLRERRFAVSGVFQVHK